MSGTTTTNSASNTVRSNARAAQSASAGGDGNCPFCQRQGFPILPLRYAVLPTFLQARPANILAGDATLEQFANLPLKGHKYTLRSLRKGFVHVWLNRPGQWQVYAVTEAGYLRKLTDPDDPDAKTERELGPQCMRERHNVPASFVHIPPGHPTAWIAFSEIVWGRAVRAAAEKTPASRMQRLDIEALASNPDAQKHAFELLAGGAKLRSLVDEYAVDESEYASRTRYQARDATDGKLKPNKWEGAFGAHGRSGQHESVARYATTYTQDVQRKQKKVRKVPAFALLDPVGILKELNHTRLYFAESKQNYVASVMRPLIVSQSIDGLEKIIRQSTLAARTADETAKKQADEQTVYLPGGDFGPPISFTTTRVERATADANQIWTKLEGRLQPGAKKAFQDRYRSTLAQFDREIGEADASWSVWAKDAGWLKWFSDYDASRAEERAALLKNHAAVLAGGIVDIGSAQVWKTWLSSQPFDDKNPIYRTLFGDYKPFLSFMSPDVPDEGDAKVNKSDKLYDSIKALLQSDQGHHSTVWATTQAKAAAAEVGLAITGSAAALGREINDVAHQTSLRAQAAALKVYENVDATFLRVQLTVGEYQRLLAEVAFDTKRVLERSVTGLIKEGDQVIKSVVLGGLMSVNNPKARDTIIDVVLWSLEKLDDIKRQLDVAVRQFGQAKGEALQVATAGAAVISREGAALARSLRLASLTLDREAGRILGVAQGSLRLSAAAARTFAKSMMTRTLRIAGGSGEILLAAGALAFQAWSIRDGTKDVKDKLGALSSEAQLGVVSAGVGITGASLELMGAASMKLGATALGERLIFRGGIVAAGASFVDSVQCGFSARRTYAKGDKDAALLYGIAGTLFAVSGGFGVAATIAGASSLLGPFGIALALVAIGVIVLWAAINAEDTIAEIWMDRCYFGKGKRTEGKWNDSQLGEELMQLNAIVVGLGAQLGFNDDWLGIGEVVTGYDTVRAKVTMGGYDPARSAYEWTLFVHHRDGRKLAVTGGRAGLPTTASMQSIKPGGKNLEDISSWFRNYQRSSTMDGGSLVMEDSVEVKTSLFQKVSIDAKYWLDKNDNQALAQVKMEESD